MIRHENKWNEAAELAGTTLITCSGLAFDARIRRSEQVWKGGQQRALASSVANLSLASRSVNLLSSTADSRVLIEYYGGGLPIGRGFLHPADVVSLDRYVEVGISADSIRNLGGMQQVAIRLKSADGNEVHGLASGALSDAFIHGSETEMLGDAEIASYRNGLDPKWIGVENFHAGSVQSSRRRATDSLQGTRWYIRTRTHRINRWVL